MALKNRLGRASIRHFKLKIFVLEIKKINPYGRTNLLCAGVFGRLLRSPYSHKLFTSAEKRHSNWENTMTLPLKALCTASVLAMTLGTAALADAHGGKVKIGLITTLTGGGAALGTDTRDGFMLAIDQAGNDNIEVVIEDDQRKPDVAVQAADKMIQSDKVDILTGIVWSNLALAVAPAANAQGKFYISTNAASCRLSFWYDTVK